MTQTDLTKAWRAQRSAAAAARLEDDASPRQLAIANRLQAEAVLAVRALAGAPSADGRTPDFVEHADPEELRVRLAARRVELNWSFCAAHVAFARQSWRSLSLRMRVSLAAAVCVMIAVLLASLLAAPKDLARGRSWTASSSDQGAAISGRLRNGDAAFFFHTIQEQGPFIEIDLEHTRTIRRVVVANRKDCCPARALPLVLEASEDRKHWKPLGRRERPFSRWKASFDPTRARWLRLSVPRVTWLHLQNVAVY
jgi:hypothetical protein